MKQVLLLFTLFTLTSVRAQHISGVVQDSKTREPLPLVNVYVAAGKGSTTDKDGKFLLALNPGDYKLTVSYVGYQTQVIAVKVTADKPAELLILLEEQIEMLETVVISAGKFEQRIEETTVSIEVVKPYIISNKNTLKLEETLNQTPGVQVSENQPNIRSGSGWSYGAGSRVTVLVDGMPMMSPDAAQVQWKLLPNETLLQTEVIKGASSALYGTSALNGVINFRTITAGEKPATGVTVYSGMYDNPARASLKWWEGTRFYYGLNAYHAVKVKNVNLVASTFLLKDPGYLYDVVDNRARFNLKADVESKKVPGLNYGVNGSVAYTEGGDVLIWKSYEHAYIPFDSAASRASGTDYYLDPYVTYRKNHTLHSLKGRFLGINNNAASKNENYENFSTYIYTEYQVQHFFDNNLTLTGGLMGAWAQSNSEIFQGRHSTTNNAVYVQADKKFDRLVASLGVRYESFRLDERTFKKPVLRAGLTYQVAEATWLRGSYGEGFRFPSMAEQLTNTTVGAINVFPNGQIQPEEGWSGELGIKQGVALGSSWKGFLDLSGFLMRYNNMIEFSFGKWNNLPGFLNFANYGFKSINVGSTQISGVEFTFTGAGNIGPLEVRTILGYAYMNPVSLNPDVAYAYTYGTGTEPDQPVTFENSSSDPTNNVLKYRYKHLAKADAEAAYKKFTLGFSVRYNDFMQNIDKVFEDPFFQIVVPGVLESREQLNKGDFFIDLRFLYQVNETLRLAVMADNLLNREYSPRPAALGPPRRFTLQMQFRF